MTCFKNVLIRVAGSIPTEFGKLINMTNLILQWNKLTGTAALLILSGLVVVVYHCNNVVVFVVLVAALQAVLQVVVVQVLVQVVVVQVALSVVVRAKVCTDALSVSYLAHRWRGVQGVHEEECGRMHRSRVTARRKTGGRGTARRRLRRVVSGHAP